MIPHHKNCSDRSLNLRRAFKSLAAEPASSYQSKPTLVAISLRPEKCDIKLGRGFNEKSHFDHAGHERLFSTSPHLLHIDWRRVSIELNIDWNASWKSCTGLWGHILIGNADGVCKLDFPIAAIPCSASFFWVLNDNLGPGAKLNAATHMEGRGERREEKVKLRAKEKASSLAWEFKEIEDSGLTR